MQGITSKSGSCNGRTLVRENMALGIQTALSLKKLIQKVWSVLYNSEGRLISFPLPICYLVQFKLVTSPCNLLIFPCQEALTALYLQQEDYIGSSPVKLKTAMESLVSAGAVSADWFFPVNRTWNAFRLWFLTGVPWEGQRIFIIIINNSIIWILTQI